MAFPGTTTAQVIDVAQVGETKFVFGVRPTKLISNLPADAVRMRLRMRRKEFAEVLVKTTSGIQRHYVEDCGGTWRLGPLIGKNQRNLVSRESLRNKPSVDGADAVLSGHCALAALDPRRARHN